MIILFVTIPPYFIDIACQSVLYECFIPDLLSFLILIYLDIILRLWNVAAKRKVVWGWLFYFYIIIKSWKHTLSMLFLMRRLINSTAKWFAISYKALQRHHVNLKKKIKSNPELSRTQLTLESVGYIKHRQIQWRGRPCIGKLSQESWWYLLWINVLWVMKICIWILEKE